ncbi:MAG: MBL fold metallo-hydrolase, partial [Coxiellaceae bacterium]|nr:MBL fold metallo-hydrolase [Coxiellaceae bacterium]
WLGHATSLIQIEEMNILIDPNFSDWTPPVFHRYTPPGIRREYLPKINLLLLSHNHADHAIPDDLRYLAEHHDPVVIVGRGSRLWLEQFGFTNIIEADWWDELMLEDDSITITAIPAQHGSQTTLTNLNKMLWCGFMIQSENETIYYTGDTAIGHEMRNRELEKTALFPQVHERFPQIDTLLLPIAPDGEENVHINHVQACSAIQLLQPKTVIPIHHATLRTGAERVEEPIINFMREAENKALTNIVPLKIGGSHPAPNTQHCISQTLWKKQSEPSTNPNPATLEPKVI